MAPPLWGAWLVLVLAVGGAEGGACTGKRWSLKGSGALSDGAGNYSVMGECVWVLHGEPPRGHGGHMGTVGTIGTIGAMGTHGDKKRL